MKIGDFNFKNSTRTFIVAELSANHNKDINVMIESIKEAKRIGANAVKIQTYTPDTMTIESNKSDFFVKGTIWNNQNLYSLYKEAYTPWEWHKKLFKVAEEIGIIIFSTPFDKTSVDFLEKLNVPAYKIASFEITDIPLIKYIASKKKPIILSTGIAYEDDIRLALSTIRSEGNNEIILLKCTSSYPSPIGESNLVSIRSFDQKYQVIPGLSDHTLGKICPVVAVSLGARFIEKHFKLNDKILGPDSDFSMNSKDFKLMVQDIRNAEKALGKKDMNPSDLQVKGRKFARSLYVVKNVKKGETFSDKNVKSIRPGFGLHPKYLVDIIGKKSKLNLEKGTRFSLDFIK
ncbi:pseudaminic acid synthase [bacterium]|nr:pseudaminic acid synthase [Bacteroidota bacterium]MDC3064150.1 pseudaminic acid synthase [bacterium]